MKVAHGHRLCTDWFLKLQLTRIGGAKWSQVLLAVGLLAFHVVCDASIVAVSVGIDTSEAQRILHMNSTHEAERGIWVFPNANDKVYEYRFDSTFGGKVSGVGVGDPIGYALAKLGTPIRTFASGKPGLSYIFESSERQIRVDVDAQSKVEMILLLKGTADLTDPDRVREGILPIFPRARPAPHDPNERSVQRPVYGTEPAIGATPAARAQSTPVQTQCISLPEVQPSMPPPMLYAAVRECIVAGRLRDADDVFRLAGLFWRFDVTRVPDETAHGVGQVLIMNTMNSVSPEARQQFGKLAMKMETDEVSTQKIVATARHLGPPMYNPRYMVDHGLRPSAPKPDFNAQQEWAGLLTTLSESVALQKAKDNDASLFKLQETYRVSTVAWSPNGKYLVTASWEPRLRNVHVWSTRDRASAAVFDVAVGNGGLSRSIAWSPDSQFLATCISRPRLAVQIYESSSWTLAHEILTPEANGCRQLAFSADGRSLAIVGDTLVVVDTKTWKSTKEIREIEGRNIRYVAAAISFTREGILLIAERHWETAEHAVGQVWFLDPRAVVPTRHVEVYSSDPQIADTPISNIAVNPHTGEFAVSGWINRQILKSYSFRIFSREGRLLAAPLDSGDDAEGQQAGLSYTPDGKLLFVGYRDKEGTVRIVDADKHTVLKTIQTGASIYDLAVSPDGQQLATSHDFTAAVWSIRKLR